MKQIGNTNYQYHKTEAVEFSDMVFVEQAEVDQAGGQKEFERNFKQSTREEFEQIFGRSYSHFNFECKWEAFGDGWCIHFSGSSIIHVSGSVNIKSHGASRS